jgi:hypothetical protein
MLLKVKAKLLKVKAKLLKANRVNAQIKYKERKLIQ